MIASTKASPTSAPTNHGAAPADAENRRLKLQAQRLAAGLAECAGYIASVRKDRTHRDEDGEVFALQTMAWADGAEEIAEQANSLLEAYDAGTLGNDDVEPASLPNG